MYHVGMNVAQFLESRNFVLVANIIAISMYLSVLSVTTSWNQKLQDYPVMYDNSQLDLSSGVLFQYTVTSESTAIITPLEMPLFTSNCSSSAQGTPPCTLLSETVPRDYTYQCKMVKGGNLVISLRRPRMVYMELTGGTDLIFENVDVYMSTFVNSFVLFCTAVLVISLVAESIILSLVTGGQIRLQPKGERLLLVIFSLFRRSVYVVPLYLVILPLVGGTDMATLALACFWAVLMLQARVGNFWAYELGVSVHDMKTMQDNAAGVDVTSGGVNDFTVAAVLAIELVRVIFVCLHVSNFGVVIKGFADIFGGRYSERIQSGIVAGCYAYLLGTYFFDLTFTFFMRQTYKENIDFNNNTKNGGATKPTLRVGYTYFAANTLLESILIPSLILAIDSHLSLGSLVGC